jgi:phage terminase large subunit
MGLDWGFSSDPTALIDVHRFNGCLYLDEIIYQTGLTNSDIIATLNKLGISKHHDIIADSAEPKSIEDLRRGGYHNIKPAKKGEDSIRNSIDTLQQFKMYITKRSLNLINEARMYRWETGKDGKSTGKPIDAYNHGFDCVRYVALAKINKSTSFDYHFG